MQYSSKSRSTASIRKESSHLFYVGRISWQISMPASPTLVVWKNVKIYTRLGMAEVFSMIADQV